MNRRPAKADLSGSAAQLPLALDCPSGVRVVFSDRTDPLLDALAQAVAAARAQDGPFEQLTLVVPGVAMSAHIQQGLALRLGIAAHLDLRPLRAVLADVVARSLPGVELAGPESLSLGLLQILHDPATLEDPSLAPVARYLEAPDPSARDERRVQLAQALGPLLDAYVLHRPDWLPRLRAESDAPHTFEHPWQAALFRRLVGPGGPFAPEIPTAERPRRRWLLTDALEYLPGLHPPRRLFVFDVPVRSPVVAELLRRVGLTAEVHIFALNPCLEFWDDIDLGLKASDLAPPRAPALPPDPLALRLWGRADLEGTRIISSLTQWDAELRPSPSEGPPKHLLEAFQRSVTRREPEPLRSLSDAGSATDRSFEVTRAPGIRRECEAIGEEIGRLMDDDPSLRFSDIVVALGAAPEAALYRNQLAAAFAELGDIPFHELDVPLAEDSSIIDALCLLFALPESSFTREDLLRVLTHPAVRARHGLGETDDWLAWCERLGIVHGAEHADHEHTYIDKDLFNWDQGLRRLALGTFMASEGLGLPEPVTVGPSPVLPVDVTGQQLDSAARLIALARSLMADARALLVETLPLSTWSEYLHVFASAYVGPVSDDDERDLQRALRAIEDLASASAAAMTEVAVSYRTAASLVVRGLVGLRTHRGQPLAEAVVVAPLTEVAALPFRVAFLPGLGEGCFPAGDRPSALDLRKSERRLGDLSPRDRDEHAFLFRLLTTDDAVRLSFVARDPETGDALPPSPTLSELIGILERGFVGPGGVPIRTEPLRRHERPSRASSAQAERDASILGDALRAVLPTGSPPPDLPTIQRAVAPAIWAKLARRLRIHWPEESPRPAEDQPRVHIAQLRRFLEDPLQGWAQKVLGLMNDDAAPDPLARNDERFEVTRLDTAMLLRSTFLTWLASGEPDSELERRYEAAADQLELSGALPTGVFGQTARKHHRETLAAWRIRLVEAVEGRRPTLIRLELGRAGAPGPAGQPAPPIELSAGVLVGTTEPVFPEGGSFILVERALRSSGRTSIREDLRAWLTQLTWCALDRSAPNPWPSYVAGRGERLLQSHLAPADGPSARAQLETLVGDLLSHVHGYRFPLETQVRLHRARKKGSSRRQMQEILHTVVSDGFGPLDDVGSLFPPPLEDALAIIDRRLGPFLVARQTEE